MKHFFMLGGLLAGFVLSALSQSTTSLTDSFEDMMMSIAMHKKRGYSYKSELFVYEEIKKVKAFLISNATWSQRGDTSYRLPCINTVKSSVERLYFGESAISQTKVKDKVKYVSQSKRSMFWNYGTNRILDFARQMVDSGLIRDYAEINFYGSVGGDTVKLNANNICGADNDTVPIRMAGSAYHRIKSMISTYPGWSVFLVSISNGFHSAILLVHNRVDGKVEMYFGDHQRRERPYSSVHQLDKIGNKKEAQYGYIRLGERTDPGSKIIGADDFFLFEVQRYAGHNQTELDQPLNCVRNLPVVRFWKIARRTQHNSPAFASAY